MQACGDHVTLSTRIRPAFVAVSDTGSNEGSGERGDSAERVGGRRGALSDHPRRGAGEVEHGRRSARQLAPVDERATTGSDLLRHVVQPPGIRSTVEVRARGDHGADTPHDFCSVADELRHAHADGVRPAPGQPRETVARVPEHERVRPREQLVHDQLCTAAQLGKALEEGVQVRAEERRRLLLRPLLESVEASHGRLPIRVSAEPVDGVDRQNDGLPGLDRRHRVLYDSHRPSTTRSLQARSGVASTGAKPRSERSAETSRAVPSANTSTSQAPGRSTSRAAAAIAFVTPRPSSASFGSQSRTSGWSVASSEGSTYGGVETTRSYGPPRNPPATSCSSNRTRAASPVSSAFSRARSSASLETSIAVTRAPGCSSAIARAIAPVPVPTSSTSGSG